MRIEVSLAQQALTLFDDDNSALQVYPVSTAARGAGEVQGSCCTPRGRHLIRAKVGEGLPENAVLVGRRPTGEVYGPEMEAESPGRDWILTRILWLSGCEVKVNRLGNVDTMRRYIYIHGCPDSAAMGIPQSHGCIRMRNRDVIDLFDRVPVYTPVDIREG